MTKHVMLILIGSREEAVEKVQKVLTAGGVTSEPGLVFMGM